MPFLKSWDQVFAMALLPIILPLLAILYVVVVPLQGRPFFFASERMRNTEEAFLLIKLRTMEPRSCGKSNPSMVKPSANAGWVTGVRCHCRSHRTA